MEIVITAAATAEAAIRHNFMKFLLWGWKLHARDTGVKPSWPRN